MHQSHDRLWPFYYPRLNKRVQRRRPSSRVLCGEKSCNQTWRDDVFTKGHLTIMQQQRPRTEKTKSPQCGCVSTPRPLPSAYRTSYGRKRLCRFKRVICSLHMQPCAFIDVAIKISSLLIVCRATKLSSGASVTTYMDYIERSAWLPWCQLSYARILVALL